MTGLKADFEVSEVSVPSVVLILLVACYCKNCPEALHRGYCQDVIGHGISVGGTHYSVAPSTLIDRKSGSRIDCVRLSVRGRAFDHDPEKPYEIYFPYTELAEITITIGIGDKVAHV